MSVYSVMLSDEKILRALTSFKSIAILGCTACANASIAYDKDLPVGKLLTDKETGRTRQIPVAIAEEANRLKAILENKGIDVKLELRPILCTLSDATEPDDISLINRCGNAEAVVALCCAGGALGIKKRFGNTVKIIPAMKTVGVYQSYTVRDSAKGLVYIDKKKSTVIRLFGRQGDKAS
jgi:hypothetical protein